jgi:hypothetical protein
MMTDTGIGGVLWITRSALSEAAGDIDCRPRSSDKGLRLESQSWRAMPLGERMGASEAGVALVNLICYTIKPLPVHGSFYIHNP